MKRMKYFIMLVSMFCMGCFWSYGQTNHQYSYFKNSSGMPFVMTEENDIKVVENKGNSFVLGDLSIFMFADAADEFPCITIFLSDGSSKDSRIKNILRKKEVPMKISLSNGEKFNATGMVKAGASSLFPSVGVTFNVYKLDNKGGKSYKEMNKYMLNALSSYDITKIVVDGYSFVFDSTVDKPFKTAGVFKTMRKELKDNLINKGNL